MVEDVSEAVVFSSVMPLDPVLDIPTVDRIRGRHGGMFVLVCEVTADVSDCFRSPSVPVEKHLCLVLNRQECGKTIRGERRDDVNQ